MRLKDYQSDVLETLSRYLRVLSERREDAEETFEFKRSKGREAKLADFCRETWDNLHEENALPTLSNVDGTRIAPAYIARKDGIDRIRRRGLCGGRVSALRTRRAGRCGGIQRLVAMRTDVRHEDCSLAD